ncbi:MAG: hypothetical protein ABFS22_05495 [Pseudomonadota bacterium]
MGYLKRMTPEELQAFWELLTAWERRDHERIMQEKWEQEWLH